MCPLLLTLQGSAPMTAAAGRSGQRLLPTSALWASYLVRRRSRCRGNPFHSSIRKCYRVVINARALRKPDSRYTVFFSLYGFWPGSNLFSEVKEGPCPELPHIFLFYLHLIHISGKSCIPLTAGYKQTCRKWIRKGNISSRKWV